MEKQCKHLPREQISSSAPVEFPSLPSSLNVCCLWSIYLLKYQHSCDNFRGESEDNSENSISNKCTIEETRHTEDAALSLSGNLAELLTATPATCLGFHKTRPEYCCPVVAQIVASPTAPKEARFSYVLYSLNNHKHFFR